MREEAARRIAHYPRYFWMKKDNPVTSYSFRETARATRLPCKRREREAAPGEAV